ncbi:MAG TPA: sulfatase [Thermoanaerobaculia bacterium]|nr:sulfatase [Thermoanaerobaculia bacterium]
MIGDRTARRPLTLALVAPALVGSLLAGCGPSDEPYQYRRAPIVLVDLSGLRADRLGAFGGGPTPHLDRFAAESVVFEWAFTPSPHAGPARASLLTGRYPVALGVLADGGDLDEGTATLAAHLAGHGYRTAAFVEDTGGVTGLEQGFEEWDDRGRGAGAVLARAGEWLGGAGDGPFFLFVQARVPEGAATYDQAVAAADEAIGVLLRALDARGRGERAVVAVTSSHGFPAAEGEEEPVPDATVGSDVHVAVARVPLLLRLPGAHQRREPRITDLVDVAPTLLELVGIEPDAKVQGDSLVAILDQRGRPPYLAFTDSIDPEGGLAVAMAGYRLVLQRSTERVALYRLTDDPLERADLAAEEPDKVAVLRRRLEEWQRAVLAGGADGEGVSADDEMLEQLRNLGYIQ